MLRRFHQDGARPKSLVNLNAHLPNLYAGEIEIEDVKEKVTIFCMEFLRGMTIIHYLEQLSFNSIIKLTFITDLASSCNPLSLAHTKKKLFGADQYARKETSIHEIETGWAEYLKAVPVIALAIDI